MIKPQHVGPVMSWEGSKNPSGAEVAATLGGGGSPMQKSHRGCCLQPRGDQLCLVSGMSPWQGPVPLRAMSVPDTWSHRAPQQWPGGPG